MMRLPGSINNKSSGNGTARRSVTAHPDTGGPLTIAEVDERLTEIGIDEQDDDRRPAARHHIPPAEWPWAENTCP